ncbi:hypothetical protein ACF0H5_019562 [Mactra antiquata]
MATQLEMVEKGISPGQKGIGVSKPPGSVVSPAERNNTVEVEDNNRNGLLYTAEEVPPWYTCIILGFQHYVTAVADIIAVPLMLREYFCMDEDTVGVSALIGTILFVSGLNTLLQTTFGARLPIVQGGTVTFVVPTIAILLQPQWICPYREARKEYGVNANFTELGLPPVGSTEHRAMWMARICEIQGAIIVASMFQVVIGFSGIMTFLLRYIGPLCISPTLTLAALSLFPLINNMVTGQVWISVLTIFLITLFSQYMKSVKIPFCSFGPNRSCTRTGVALFLLYPVLLAVLIVFLICLALTATDVFPNDPTKHGYLARTDTKLYVLSEAPWFRFPYPFQWGTPTVSTVGVFGMLSGVITAMIESLGDYYACARLAGAPPPPLHAVNRAIFMEGTACVLAGIWGSGNGTTSYSENIGLIGITRVGSRRVVQVCAIMLMAFGCFGKFGAVFMLIPTPVIGGMIMVTFGMVTAVGIANLKFVDLNSQRNLFIIGVSLFVGLSLPMWVQEHTNAIKTGNDIIDQLLTVLFSTNMFVGGLLGFVLDNTIPGTDEERGMTTWRAAGANTTSSPSDNRQDLYDMPVIQRRLDRYRIFQYLPICPRFGKRK